jgi:hypothetical protein
MSRLNGRAFNVLRSTFGPGVLATRPHGSFLGEGDVIHNPATPDQPLLAVIYGIARPGVPVSWLANATRIEYVPELVQRKGLVFGELEKFWGPFFAVDLRI